METNSVNIYIVYSGFQVFIAEILAKKFKVSKNVIIKKAINSVEDCFDEIISTSEATVDKILDVRKAKKVLDKYTKEKYNTNIFFPHIGGLLPNYSFEKHHNKANVNLNLMYEGMLFLYEYDYSYLKDSKTIRNRKIISKLLNLKYSFNSDIYQGHSDRIHQIYTLFPEITMGPKQKMIKIHLPKESIDFEENKVLLLGQKSSLMNKQQHLNWYNRIFEVLKNRNIEEFSFKGHPRDDSTYFQEALAAFDFKVHYLNSDLPVEKIIAEIKASIVISLFSSGLVNLKGLYQDEIEILSFIPDNDINNFENKNITKLIEVINKLNIKTYSFSFN